MKPAPFAYARPDSLDEALAVLAEHDDAKALAGGQSLVPAMNFRLAQPTMLVDLNGIRELSGVEEAEEGLTIGAMTRHRELERSPLVARMSPLLSETMPFIAHPPIRTRGTIGGSLAHADPAAELPAVMLALDAAIGVRSRAGGRTIPAAEFFVGLYATALAAGELVVKVSVPAMPPGAGWAFDEVARRHGDYALAGAAAVVALDGGGVVRTARIALLSVHDRPILAVESGHTLVGERPTPEAIAAAAAAAANRDADPSSDIHASRDYRRHLASVLVRRVLTRAVTRATTAG